MCERACVSVYEAAYLLDPESCGEMGLREFGEGKCTDLRGARTSLRISYFLSFLSLFSEKKNTNYHILHKANH